MISTEASSIIDCVYYYVIEYVDLFCAFSVRTVNDKSAILVSISIYDFRFLINDPKNNLEHKFFRQIYNTSGFRAVFWHSTPLCIDCFELMSTCWRRTKRFPSISGIRRKNNVSCRYRLLCDGCHTMHIYVKSAIYVSISIYDLWFVINDPKNTSSASFSGKFITLLDSFLNSDPLCVDRFM